MESVDIDIECHFQGVGTLPRDEVKYREALSALEVLIEESLPQCNLQLNRPPRHFVRMETAAAVNAAPGSSYFFDLNAQRLVAFPRSGAFEVKLGERVLFSKLLTNLWPNPFAIVRTIKDMLDHVETGEKQAAVVEALRLPRIESRRRAPATERRERGHVRGRSHQIIGDGTLQSRFRLFVVNMDNPKMNRFNATIPDERSPPLRTKDGNEAVQGSLASKVGIIRRRQFGLKTTEEERSRGAIEKKPFPSLIAISNRAADKPAVPLDVWKLADLRSESVPPRLNRILEPLTPEESRKRTELAKRDKTSITSPEMRSKGTQDGSKPSLFHYKVTSSPMNNYARTNMKGGSLPVSPREASPANGETIQTVVVACIEDLVSFIEQSSIATIAEAERLVAEYISDMSERLLTNFELLLEETRQTVALNLPSLLETVDVRVQEEIDAQREGPNILEGQLWPLQDKEDNKEKVKVTKKVSKKKNEHSPNQQSSPKRITKHEPGLGEEKATSSACFLI